MHGAAITLLLSLACTSPVCLADKAAAPVEQKKLLGQPRPTFTLPDRNGSPQSIAQWDGRIIVLNFWATWCTPCRTEIPLLNTLQKELGPRGVQVIGVAVDNVDAVKQFAQTISLDYPVLIGGADAIALVARYGNVAGALPYTVFITRDGRIESLASGALTDGYARGKLEKMLGTTRE